MIVRTPEAHEFTGARLRQVAASSSRTGLSRTGLTGNSVQTKRLYLSPLGLDDVNDLQALFGHRSVARMTHSIAHPFTESDARAFAEKARHNTSLRLPVFGIHDENETLIGVTGLERTVNAGLHQFGPSLGICIAPEHQGQGYGTEAVEGLIGYAERFGGHRVLHAAHFADNAASARLLARAGFLYTGRKTQETSKAREGTHEALHMIRLL
ncbi:MAG: GNAT family N-acetyltransferase [Asticcacaulis sp.]